MNKNVPIRFVNFYSSVHTSFSKFISVFVGFTLLLYYILVINDGYSMENFNKFVLQVQKFYALVETHESNIQNWINEAKKPLHSITNQSVFYRAVSPEDSVVNTPFEHFQGFRESLTENIFTSLQKEFNLLEEIRNKINSANEKLQKEQVFLENIFTDLRFKGLVNPPNLNPCCPSFDHIIDWSHELWCYYHSFYLQISQALINLRYEDENTVKSLTGSFKEDCELKKRINKIRSFKFSEFEFTI